MSDLHIDGPVARPNVPETAPVLTPLVLSIKASTRKRYGYKDTDGAFRTSDGRVIAGVQTWNVRTHDLAPHAVRNLEHLQYVLDARRIIKTTHEEPKPQAPEAPSVESERYRILGNVVEALESTRRALEDIARFLMK